MVLKMKNINTTMLELPICFFLHILQSNKGKTYYNFDFLLVFKYAKEHGIGQSFEDTFYTYLEGNDTHVFTMEKKYLNFKKEKTLHILEKKKVLDF